MISNYLKINPKNEKELLDSLITMSTNFNFEQIFKSFDYDYRKIHGKLNKKVNKIFKDIHNLFCDNKTKDIIIKKQPKDDSLVETNKMFKDEGLHRFLGHEMKHEYIEDYNLLIQNKITDLNVDRVDINDLNFIGPLRYTNASKSQVSSTGVDLTDIPKTKTTIDLSNQSTTNIIFKASSDDDNEADMAYQYPCGSNSIDHKDMIDPVPTSDLFCFERAFKDNGLLELLGEQEKIEFLVECDNLPHTNNKSIVKNNKKKISTNKIIFSDDEDMIFQQDFNIFDKVLKDSRDKELEDFFDKVDKGKVSNSNSFKQKNKKSKKKNIFVNDNNDMHTAIDDKDNDDKVDIF